MTKTEQLEKEIHMLREALEAALIACPYDCNPDSHCGRCRIPLEALGMIPKEDSNVSQDCGSR